MKPFAFSRVPLDPQALRAGLADPACGGYAAFEGWVRDHNEGHAVTRLEYEAFETLAVREGTRIVAEAIEKFGVDHAACVHRIGDLALGELAVWVGVSAGHRAEAFAACRYIIDEVKHRVPIWKKEHYANGDSGWVNCERCAAHAHGATAAHTDGADHAHAVPAVDYSRQMALPQVGAAGQAKLAAARVLVVGAGGLGVPVLTSLAGAGVGVVGIADGDRLEASNLHRQTLYALADVGQPKAELAAARLRALNPGIEVRVHPTHVDAANVDSVLAPYDLVIECSDNFATKFLVNDAALRAAKPLVLASVYQYEGQLQVYDPRTQSACLRCLWPQGTRDGLVGNCATAGVLGPIPGTLGQLQALEALKLILDLPGRLDGELLLVDLLDLRISRVRATRAGECRNGSCVRAGPRAPESTEHADVDRDFEELERALAEGFRLVDVREPEEARVDPVPVADCVRIPVAALLENPDLLDSDGASLLICTRGQRSRALALELRDRNRPRVYSLRGGLARLRARQPA
jgi:molybdopterin/thiamine biosynthesis adenylyltransferase/molybdopterin synthase catalytic subunit/rhodanese-related sulfurtransferase